MEKKNIPEVQNKNIYKEQQTFKKTKETEVLAQCHTTILLCVLGVRSASYMSHHLFSATAYTFKRSYWCVTLYKSDFISDLFEKASMCTSTNCFNS